ncbi:hypothetical protein MMC34_003227 [Xylographa carneopallida]|nr:hypothetical protein [Xylographa carneopallida]
MASEFWKPLDRARRQIRLAHLAPSNRLDDQPSLSLRIVSLDENHPYEALSYVWGDPKITAPIQLRSVHQRSINVIASIPLSSHLSNLSVAQTFNIEESKPSVMELATNVISSGTHKVQVSAHSDLSDTCTSEWPVTTNLETAMKYLRHEFAERILWIDAICIDQSNITERNSQVPLMQAIYSNAEVVHVWLGSPTTGSDNAMALLKEVGQGVLLQEIKLQDRLIDDNDLRSTTELMTRAWWNRTWVQQELLLAKRAVFSCGFSSFEWSSMPSADRFNSLVDSAMKSLRFDEYVLDDFTDSFDAHMRIQNMEEIHDKGTQDEDFVLIMAQGRLCQNTDKRDSVYGFLGLMSDNIASRIKPDYNMSVCEVFQDAATQLTICAQSLILFSLTQYMPKDTRSTPTWVPSWNTLSGVESLEEWSNRSLRLIQHDYFSSCAEHDLKFEVVNPNMSKLSGTQFDHIRGISSGSAPCDPTLPEVLKLHHEWRLVCNLENESVSHYIVGGKASDAYWRTLINDIYKGVGESRRRCQTSDYKAYLEWLHELENSTTAYWDSDLANSFHISYSEACMDRRFFVTKKGYFGIGPAELKEGDEIYILAGGKHPFALRPLLGPHPDTFELVGDCYVHGIMDGEAVSDRSRDQNTMDRKKHEELPDSQSLEPYLPLHDFHDVFIV